MKEKLTFGFVALMSGFFSVLGTNSLKEGDRFFGTIFSTTLFFILAAACLLVALGIFIGMFQKNEPSSE